MVPKSLAVSLLLGSCVAAAGGGAYIASLQHARSTTAAASMDRAAVSSPTPQAVASGERASAIPAVPSQASAEGAVSVDASVPTAAPSAPVSTPAPKKSQSKALAKPEPNADGSAAASRPADPPSANQGSAAPAPMPPVADPAASAQRPWPGPPSSGTSPVPPVSGGGEAPRGDGGEAQARDNVKLWEELVVPNESVLGLQLESTLSTDQARVEDRVEARVTRDVRVSGRAAIPAGSHVVGSVMLVERGGKMKDRARIGIRFHTLVLADGARMPITTDTVYRESESPGDKASAKIGGAAIGGAIIGAIIGGGKGAAIGSGIGAAGGTAAAMTADRMRVVMPAGTNVSVRTLAPITITVEK